MTKAGSNDDLVQLAEQVTLLRKEVAEIRRQVANMPNAATTAASTTTPFDGEARLEAERAEQLRVAATESAFHREEIDARWSLSAAASARAALAQAKEALGNEVRSIECRSRTCRIEIAAGGSSLSQQELPSIIRHLSQTLPNMTAAQVDEGNGRHATVLYLSR